MKEFLTGILEAARLQCKAESKMAEKPRGSKAEESAWRQHQRTIEKLFKDENMSLKEVRKVMAELYGFNKRCVIQTN